MFRVMKRSAHKLILCIIIISFGAFLEACIQERSLKLGEAAPELSAVDLTDKTIKLSDFRGKVVVLRFWSSGCRACVAEMPILDAVSKRHRERGLAVLAVNVGDTKESVEKFVKSLNISYPVLLDPARITARKYRVTAVPTTILIDRNGIARKRIAGETTQEQFEKTVAGLLNGKAGQAPVPAGDLRDDVHHHSH